MNEESVNSQPDATTVEAVPKTWPGAFGAYKYTKAAILQNWKSYLLVVILTMVVGGIQEAAVPSDQVNTEASPFGIVVVLLSIVVSLILGIALVRIILAGVNRKKITVLEEVKQSISLAPAYFLMAVVSSIILIVSFILLVIPFFFVMPRLVLAEYFLIDKKMGPVESIKASWAATKGNATKVWGVVVATILMALLMITIIGIPFAVYFLFMYSAAFGVLYAYLTRSKVEDAAESSDPIVV